MPTRVAPNSSLLQQMLLWGEEEGGERATSPFLFSCLPSLSGLAKAPHLFASSVYFLGRNSKKPIHEKKAHKNLDKNLETGVKRN